MDHDERQRRAAGMIVHHTDAEREYAYDPALPHFGSSTWRWTPRP